MGLFNKVSMELDYVFYRGVWDERGDYDVDDIVERDKHLFVSEVNDNIGNDPRADKRRKNPRCWRLLALYHEPYFPPTREQIKFKRKRKK